MVVSTIVPSVKRNGIETHDNTPKKARAGRGKKFKAELSEAHWNTDNGTYLILER